MSLIRASAVVNCQSALAWLASRSSSHAAVSAAIKALGRKDAEFSLMLQRRQHATYPSPDRLLDNLGRETVAAIADLGHHRWLRLKSQNGKTTGDVTRPEQEHVRLQWAQKRQPDALARLKVLEADLQHLERTGQLLIGYQLKCSDPLILAAARKNQEAAKAAIAATTGAA